MGVDITLFVETNTSGTWEPEAQFFLPRNIAMMGELSTGGVRGYGPGTFSKEGLPDDVSRKVVFEWGRSSVEDTGTPKGWGAKRFTFEKTPVFRVFGCFGEAHIDSKGLNEAIQSYINKHTPEWGLPEEYTRLLSYMERLDKDGILNRAVFWFDN